jgi:hypothetical protein
MKDSAAKKLLLQKWPDYSTDVWPVPGKDGSWIRARPAPRGKASVQLKCPGASLFKIQPDGLWLFVCSPEFVDAIVIEVCSSVQNLNDKRSRYMPSSHSLVAQLPVKWFGTTVQKKKQKLEIWQLCAGLSIKPVSDQTLPVRFLRVLYVLPSDIYDLWVPQHAPTGYEYFCVDSSLGSFTSQPMQAFLRQMSIASQFYTRPYKK